MLTGMTSTAHTASPSGSPWPCWLVGPHGPRPHLPRCIPIGEKRERDGVEREGKEICSITSDRATPALVGWEKSKHSTYTGKCFGGLSPCALMVRANASVRST